MSEPVDRGLLEAELRARREHASSGRERAVWCLLLGAPGESLAALRSDFERGEERPSVWPDVGLAFLAADPELPARAATIARDHLDRYVAGYREYVAALLALIADDEDDARAQTARLVSFVNTHDKLRSGHPAAVAQIPRGLLENDPQLLTEGVSALLAWHLRRARARSEVFNSARAMVCNEAVVALLLATRRGVQMDVDVAGKYRRASLPMLVIHIREWNGKPLPRAMPFQVESDVVAGPWLQAAGVHVGDHLAPAPAPAPVRPPRTSVRKRQADVDAQVVLESLRRSVEAGLGSRWQLASWALILGDVPRARSALNAAGSDARRRWLGEGGRNHNVIREHLGFALALGDEQGLAETIPPLQAWMRSVEHFQARYAHAGGYLDVVCDLLGGAVPGRDEAERVLGPLSSTPVACVGLVEADADLLAEGLDGMLAEHARTLERRASPPPPVCEPAVHLAVTARRLGIDVRIDDRFTSHLVPIEVLDPPSRERKVGRVPCDLLGRALWEDASYRSPAPPPRPTTEPDGTAPPSRRWWRRANGRR